MKLPTLSITTLPTLRFQLFRIGLFGEEDFQRSSCLFRCCVSNYSELGYSVKNPDQAAIVHWPKRLPVSNYSELGYSVKCRSVSTVNGIRVESGFQLFRIGLFGEEV